MDASLYSSSTKEDGDFTTREYRAKRVDQDDAPSMARLTTLYDIEQVDR